MPQLSSGLASSRSARPDPEDELLQSLGRRDALASKKLLLQLVHRRGVAALSSLRSRSLALEPDQQGWIWLNQLLDAEQLLVESGFAAVARELAVLEPIEDSVSALNTASAEAPSSSVALDLRAEAAVDAAFEALSAEFPSYGTAVSPVPEPTVAEQEPKAELIFAPQPQPSLAGEPQGSFSFVIPPAEKLEQAVSDLAPIASDPSLEGQTRSTLKSKLWSQAGGSISGLRNRLGGRLSLTRVRTLFNSCVEEAVSSLKAPGPRAEPQSLEPPALLPGQQAPEAAFGSPPALLSATQQLAQRLLSHRREDSRPAPAPQSLSDLRAWLASDDDLPRAS